MSEAFSAGQQLAEQHRRPQAPDAGFDLANLSERERAEGWTFRSALVRFAQPEPFRAAVIMELIRRSEAALSSHQSMLLDGRLIELARLTGPDAADGEHGIAVLDGYQSVLALDDAELAALPLVATVLLLDDLGDEMARWAPAAPAPAPVATVDRVCADLRDRLEQLAVPVETGPPGPGRGRRR